MTKIKDESLLLSTLLLFMLVTDFIVIAEANLLRHRW